MKEASRRAFRRRVRLGGLAAAIAVFVAVVLVPSAMSVSTSKTYQANFTSSVPSGANNQSITLSITNLGSPSLGSANITAPAGFRITNVVGTGVSGFTSSAIQLRNLNLSSSDPPLNYTITADVPCYAGTTPTWGIQVKQQGDFTGQSFTSVGSQLETSLSAPACTLSFSVFPNNANVNQVITDTAYDPSGSKVTVVAKNSSNARANAANDTVTLTKSAGFFTSIGSGFENNAKALTAGSVTFDKLDSNATGSELQLTAGATGYTSSTPSNAFEITYDGKSCPNPTCNGSQNGKHTNVSVDGAGTTNTNLGVSLLDFGVFNPVPSGVCATNSDGGFDPIPGSDGFSMTVQTDGTSQPDYTIALVYDKTIANAIPSNGVSAIQVCLGARRIGTTAPYAGLPIPCSADSGGGFPTTNDPKLDGSYTAKCDTGHAGATEAWWGFLPNTGPGINSCTDSRLTDPAVLSKNRGGSPGPGDIVITLCKPSPWDGWGGSH
jgi:hypothetical protein